jgi:hypothetical protein
VIVVARLLGASIFSAIVFLTPGALAQSAANPDRKPPDTVVVTGQRSAQDVDTIVSQFIDVHAAKNRKTGQYMRDDVWPLCPVTLGMPPAFNAFVTARVRAVAEKVGARTDKEGACKPNVEILFTDEPENVVQTLADRTRGAILGVHYAHEAKLLTRVTHPIQGWYVTATRYDENSIEPVSSIDQQGNTKPTNDKKPHLDDAYFNAPEAKPLGSNIPMRRVSAIANALVVADLRKVGGLEIGPVADYVTMLVLSEPASLDACNAFPSILDLMASGCDARPKTTALTGSDMAYLKGLYAADLGATSVSVQKDNIATGMKGELVK